MSQKFICIHGHFYQPPRENPWLEEVEVQDSAYPHHDWNERITLECYAPNAASRLLDEEGRIAELVDNYSLISFNFGPTLLTWLARRVPDVYRRIVEADRKSVQTRSGHGNALAQVYNHLIMPLASRRDKVTQAVWGVRDFQKRFGRPPEGMWLAETAADTETLEVLAELGIRFTILAPSQAGRARPIEKGTKSPWQDVSGGRIDPSRPYRWTSPKGLSLDLFFYDGPVSRAVAFEGLLGNGEFFAGRLLGAFSPERQGPQLVHIATDGESYGHHHRFGDMALAYALRKIERKNGAVLTNYGEFLARHPAQWQVEIVENSSWSCVHGVERWRSDCGCRVGGPGHWNQKWRGPLRASLDRLRDSLDALYEARAANLLKDPWLARNGYIDVVFDRSPESVRHFLEAHQTRPLNADERRKALRLLEMQRHRMYMYTSCGWFFNELSGLEGVIVLLSAARAVQLAQAFEPPPSLEEDFLNGLSHAKSNLPRLRDGATVYRRFVKPQVVNLTRVAAHRVLRGLVSDDAREGDIYCYSYRVEDEKKETRDGTTFSMGRIRVSSRITESALEAVYAALHEGGHEFQCVLEKTDGTPGRLLPREEELFRLYRAGDLDGLRGVLAKKFGPPPFSLKDLLLEDRRKILKAVIRDVLGGMDGVYSRLVEENRELMDYLQDVNMPIPEAFRVAMRYVLERDLAESLRGLSADETLGERALAVARDAGKFELPLDKVTAAELLRRQVEEGLEALLANPEPERANQVLRRLDLAQQLELTLWLWRAENLFYDLWDKRLKDSLNLAKPEAADVWPFLELADRLRFRPPQLAGLT